MEFMLTLPYPNVFYSLTKIYTNVSYSDSHVSVLKTLLKEIYVLKTPQFLVICLCLQGNCQTVKKKHTHVFPMCH